MIRRRDLVRALGTHELADWVVIERDQTIGHADDATSLRRQERRVLWQITVHHDAPSGRGSAHVTVDAADGDPEAAVRQAVTLARASVGPAWITQPAAAPARVSVEDTSLATRDPLAIATSILRELPRPSSARIQGAARVLREQVFVVTRQGLKTQWKATRLRVDLTVSANERSLTLSREARRVADLQLSSAVGGAIEDLGLLASAQPISPGPCAVILRADAMLHAGLGVWRALVTQADAVVERQGLTRYREGTPIAPRAATVDEPLTVISDGARENGLLSVPVSDQGDSVRRFPLIERGVARGLGLTPREAALRGRDPNGGVRNLVVESGSWPGTVDVSSPRVVDIRRLRSLSLDPYTGDAALEIALAMDHTKAVSRPVVGGALRLDMIEVLATCRRSAERIHRGAYVGPGALLIEHVDLIG
jgi:hypothetical protein